MRGRMSGTLPVQPGSGCKLGPKENTDMSISLEYKDEKYISYNTCSQHHAYNSNIINTCVLLALQISNSTPTSAHQIACPFIKAL